MFFEKLQNRKNDGFTLVELIVVIAILAILAGIAVPAYSGYVEKANIAADQQLAGEVANALTLYYYDSYGDETVTEKTGYVVLSTNARPSVSGSGEAAMEAVFGEEWESDESLKLKHNNHNASYQGSSFNGKETDLLGQVDALSGALAGAITETPSLIGDKFGPYLESAGLSNATADQKADAAVLYIAQNTVNADSTAYLNAIANYGNGVDMTKLMTIADTTYGGVSSLAALYAFAEGYFQYEAKENGTSAGLTTLHTAFDGKTVTSKEDATQVLLGALDTAFKAADNNLVSTYLAKGENGSPSQAVQDMQAYLDIMDTVNSAETQVMNEIKTGTGFADSTTISGLLTNYAGGGIIIAVTVNADGTLNVVNPLAGE